MSLLASNSIKQSLNRLRYLSTASDTIDVSIEEAKSTTSKALQKIGWDTNDANIQAEIMTSAEICGNNQGLVKMYQPHLMAPDSKASKPCVERDTLLSAVVNGNQSPGMYYMFVFLYLRLIILHIGMLAASLASDLAIQKVKKSGVISITSSYNTSTSSGQLGYYVGRMAQNGVIGLAFANSPEFVAAAKGGKPVFGTNPLAVGIPKKDNPFVFDMSTSAIALFGVLSSKAKGEALPKNVAYGKDGEWTTDASEVLNGGSIATFGGHKGTGLSLCVELLAGALSGSAVLGQCESKKAAKSWGHLFIAINPNALVDDYEDKVSSIIETVKQSSSEGIRIPGESSTRIANARREAGVLPIPKKIWDSILHTAEYGLK